MSSYTAPTMRQRAATGWAAGKPVAIGLAVGLVAGPLISGIAGFQVRTSTAEAAARAGVVEQQAMFCAERARAEAPNLGTLDWQGRTELARRWAAMPGSAAAEPEVLYACSSKLAG
jgi:hypothetical protein